MGITLKNHMCFVLINSVFCCLFFSNWDNMYFDSDSDRTFFFWGSGSHLPLSKNYARIMLHGGGGGGGLQGPIKWYEKKFNNNN